MKPDVQIKVWGNQGYQDEYVRRRWLGKLVFQVKVKGVDTVH